MSKIQIGYYQNMELKTQIDYHMDGYYNQDDSEISDYDYDMPDYN